MGYRRILVPLAEGHPPSEVMHQVLGLAIEEGAEVRFLSVADMAPAYESDLTQVEAIELEQAELYLDEITVERAANLARAAGVEADAQVRETNGREIAEVILDEARDWPADLIVLGSLEPPHGDNRPLGPIISDIVRAAAAPVLLIPTVSTPHVSRKVTGRRIKPSRWPWLSA